MGRHSAPDDDEIASPEPAAGSVDVAPGRHERGAEDAPGRRPAPRPAEHGTHADLRMLRENPTLRARCVAAVVVPFVLYTVVLLVVGRADIYLLWVWIPTVTAGVVVGSFLDAYSRKLHPVDQPPPE